LSLPDLHDELTRQIQRRRMTFPMVVEYFKMNTAKLINQLLASEGNPVWQRNYYEHVIRDETEYDNIQRYFAVNVANWTTDIDY
jgi:putative transposase